MLPCPTNVNNTTGLVQAAHHHSRLTQEPLDVPDIVARQGEHLNAVPAIRRSNWSQTSEEAQTLLATRLLFVSPVRVLSAFHVPFDHLPSNSPVS